MLAAKRMSFIRPMWRKVLYTVSRQKNEFYPTHVEKSALHGVPKLIKTKPRTFRLFKKKNAIFNEKQRSYINIRLLHISRALYLIVVILLGACLQGIRDRFVTNLLILKWTGGSLQINLSFYSIYIWWRGMTVSLQ
jgi:hypothetical protein